MSETIRILPWPDSIIDTLGHDPRSLYVETYWLPTLGPTALLLLRRIAALFDAEPDGADLRVADMSQSLGLGAREGRNSPVRRTLNRLVQFDLVLEKDDTTVAVRRYLPPVNRRHVRRLPAHLQESHDDWARAQLAEPAMEVARRNARRYAFTLIQLGEDLDRTERALFAVGFHPALCRESAAWAFDAHRHGLVDGLLDAGPAGAEPDAPAGAPVVATAS